MLAAVHLTALHHARIHMARHDSVYAMMTPADNTAIFEPVILPPPREDLIFDILIYKAPPHVAYARR